MKIYSLRIGVSRTSMILWHLKIENLQINMHSDKHLLGSELVSAAMLHNNFVVDMYTIIIWKICHLTSLLKNLTQAESKPLRRAHAHTSSIRASMSCSATSTIERKDRER